MDTKDENISGFSLIEVICTLVILGIIAAIAGMGVSQLVKGYMFSRENAETAQRGQSAMLRIVKEIAATKPEDFSSATGQSIKMLHDSMGSSLRWDSGNKMITINGDTLAKKVTFFSLSYYENFNSNKSDTFSSTETNIIEIKLHLEGARGIESTFSNRVFIRDPE